MNKDKIVLYPSEMLEEMQVEETIFPTGTTNEFGVTTLSHQVGSKHVLRLYQLLFHSEKDVYVIVQELASFKFETRIELDEFSKDLPHLNGLAMLILLNPLNQDSPHIH